LIRQNSIFPILNDSGEDLGRFEIIGIKDSIIKPEDNLIAFQNRIAFIGEELIFPDHVGKYGILQEPIKDGKIGKAVFAGLSVVQVDMQDEAHIAAEITDGEPEFLTSTDSGSAQILFVEEGTGQKHSIVRVGNIVGSTLVRGTLDVPMRTNETVQMTITGIGTKQDVRDVNQIEGNIELDNGNHILATIGNPGELVSFECSATTDI